MEAICIKRAQRDATTLHVEEVAQLLGISRRSAYRAVKRGDIPAVRLGGRILVPKAALQRKFGSDIVPITAASVS